MYPNRSDMTSPNWGDFWMVVVGPDGRAYLGEHVGMATLVQVQLMLENGTLPSDVVPGYGALGSSRTRADGVWGVQTLRQLYAYVNENASMLGLSATFKSSVLGIFQADIRSSTISDATIYAAFVLAYLRPRAIRRQTDAGVQRSVVQPQINLGTGNGAGLMTSGEDPLFVTFLQRLPFPASDPQVVSVPPRFVLMDENFPPPPYDVAQLAQQSGITIPGSNRNAPPGPYTIRQNELAPIRLPGTANAPRTSPQIGQIVGDGTPPPPISVPTPPPPVPGQIIPSKPPQQILVPTNTLPTMPGVVTPQVPSDPGQPPVQDGTVPVSDNNLAQPGNVVSVSKLDRALPVAGIVVLAGGALIFGAAVLSQRQGQPSAAPTRRFSVRR